jgi:hypothetical protein
MPNPFFFVDGSFGIELQAASADGAVPAKISIDAYNGGKLKLKNAKYPVVVDLDGLDIKATIPFLIDHKNVATHTLGQGNAVRRGNILYAEGILTGSGPLALEVAQNSKNGHKYQASVGVNPTESVFVPQGHSVNVNGKVQVGPLILAKKSELIEVSAVNIGADRDGTEFNIAATFGLDIPSNKERKEITMNPKLIEWVQASLGLNEEDFTALTEEQQGKITASYEATLAPKKEPKAPAKIEAALDPKLAEEVAELKEDLRVSKIEAACGSDFADLQKTAVEAGWALDQVEASIAQINKVRDDRPKAPGVIIGGEMSDGKVIEAGLAMTFTGMDDATLTASYGEETLAKAEKFRGASLKEIMAASCHIDGVNAPGIGSSPAEWAASAFSTRTFPNVLSNLANKTMMQSFTRRESVAARVSKRLSAKDFKLNTQTRISAGGGMQKLENGGEIQHGTIEDVARTYSLDTYAQMLGLTRQDIINDDLGAFNAIPEQMGFDAWQLRETAFWTMVLANTGNFFHADNGNLSTGAGSALGLAGLTAATTKMDKQTDEKGRAIAVEADMLITPSELKATNEGIHSSELLITGTGAERTDKNIYRGKYRPFSTPFLSNSTITNNSATAWYLFSDPAVLAAFNISYLNGRETPIIEETDPDPRYLGRVFRIYYDFGVDQGDPRGAVKSNGA